MSMTEKVKNNEAYRNVYMEKLQEMERQANSFKNMTKKINEDAKKKSEAQKKKRKTSDVVVTGATNKKDIRYLQRVLTKKIAEVMSENSDQKVKNIRAGNLQMKINELEKILVQIESKERQEQRAKFDEKARKEKKKKIGSLWISGEDLTINKNGKPKTGINTGSSSASDGISLSTDMPISVEIDEILSIDSASSVDINL